MRVLNDFHCDSCGHTQELYVDNLAQYAVCQKCDGEATKLLRPVKLDFIGKNFGIGSTTGEDQWVKRREKQIAWEKKRDWYEP